MTLEDERRALDEEKRALERERKEFRRRVEIEDKRLQQQQRLFEMKLKSSRMNCLDWHQKSRICKRKKNFTGV